MFTALNRFQNEYEPPSTGVDLRPYFLDDSDWVAIRRWAKLLKAFKLCERTEEHRADKSNVGTIAGVIKALTFMWEKVQEAKMDESDVSDHCSEEYVEGLNAADAKLMKYFELINNCPIYYAAVALDPSVRMHWFEDKWGRYDRGTWLRGAQRHFRSLYDTYAFEHARRQPNDTLPTEVPESQDTTIASDDDNAYRDFGGLSSSYIARKRKRVDSVSRKKDEYARYVDGVSGIDEVTDVVQWWCAHRDEYPVLFQMAMDILSIPGTSAEIERIFSQAGRLLTDDRNSLGDSTVEAIVIQNHGLRSGFFKSPTL